MRLEPSTIDECKKLLTEAQEEQCFIKTHKDSGLDIFSQLDALKEVNGFMLYCLFKGRKKIGIIFAYPQNGNMKSLNMGISYIKPKYRGRGFGKAMLELFIKLCKKNSVENILTTTWSGNESANKLYKSLGFIEQSRIEDDRENGDSTINYTLTFLK